MGKVKRKIGIQGTDALMTDGIIYEMFEFWVTCMNTYRSGNMHKNRKLR
jgi:hypothetical protein